MGRFVYLYCSLARDDSYRLLRAELQAWRKVMAAYSRVYDSRHLQADCQAPGSAPEHYAL